MTTQLLPIGIFLLNACAAAGADAGVGRQRSIAIGVDGSWEPEVVNIPKRQRPMVRQAAMVDTFSLAPTTSAICKAWCFTSRKRWSKKCTRKKWRKKCSGCCPCQFAQFEDVSSTVFETGREGDAWYSLDHSGRPMSFENTPSFPDFDGDGHLDYFSNGHFQPVYKWDVGVSIPSADGIRVYRNITATTIKQTAIFNESIPQSDTHGVSFADLDRDGVLDMLQAAGGGLGTGSIGSGSGKINALGDSLLFWGEKDGGALRLTGGYLESASAGLNARGARGRFNYLLDANGDGLLDVFTFSDRGIDNYNRVQELRMNSGKRMWRPDDSMREFARTAILTDADGDGRAEELVFQRASCYPHRKGPKKDPAYPEHGPYPKEYKTFCYTRPRGTTAIYKYNRKSETMDLISPAYTRSVKKEAKLHPLDSYLLDSNPATSSVTGDFDGDNKADLVVLYRNKFVVHYSKKRSIGELPLSGVGGVDYNVSSKCGSTAIRLLDLDLDGKQEIVVMCAAAGEFMMFKPTGVLYEWKEVRCGGGLPMFTVTNGAFQPTEDDLKEVCSVDGTVGPGGIYELCKRYHEDKASKPRHAAGMTFVDMNNDGYLDLMLSSKKGYVRFLHSVPPSPRNNFIAFELKGTTSNQYGIGATVIFTASSTPNQFQFREVSTWSHAADKYGYIENRLIFGLGSAGVPETLTVRWPSGVNQVLEVGDMNWSGSGDMNSPVKVVEPQGE